MDVMKVEKAGMGGIDKETIAKIIAENTNEKYAKHEEKQKSRIDAQVAKIKQILENISPSDLNRSEKEMDEFIVKLEESRDLERHCVHIDMDAFFAAVEMRDKPYLRTVPMAVGSTAMLSTSNYIARRYGVRSAMPGYIGLTLCPNLEIVQGNYKQYGKESKVFAQIFAEYDENISMGSLDEAYIDLTEYLKSRTSSQTLIRKRFGGECICRLPLFPKEENTDNVSQTVDKCEKCGKERVTYTDEITFGSNRAEVVKEIRFRVEQATGLTCSAGIANNFKLAKICSDINKPNGQYELDNDYETIIEFLRALPIRKVCGIGKVSEALLKACGMESVYNIYEKRALLKFVFSSHSQESFIRTGLGLSSCRTRDGDSRRKSISVERTFSSTSNADILREHIQSICKELISDIKRAGIIGGRCITLKIKLASFDVLTRSTTLPKVIKDYEEILSSANNILTKELGQPIRLLGVRLTNLEFLEDNTVESMVPDYFKPKRQRLDDDVVDMADLDIQGSESDELSSTPSMFSSESALTTVECPVCKQMIPEEDTIFNQHLDECLNRDLIKPGGLRETVSTKKHNAAEKTPNRKRKDTKSARQSAHPITNFFPVVKD